MTPPLPDPRRFAWAAALATIAPAASTQSDLALMPAEELPRLLGWCHTKTGPLLDLLSESTALMQRAQSVELGSPEWQQIDARLAEISEEYAGRVHEIYVYPGGPPLQPLHGYLAEASPTIAYPPAAFTGWEVPNNSCVAGLLLVGNWAKNVPPAALTVVPSHLVSLTESSEVDLALAGQDRENLAVQLTSMASRLQAYRKPYGVGAECDEFPFSYSYLVGLRMLVYMDGGAKEILHRLQEMQEIAIHAGSAGINPEESAQLDVHFQALDDSINKLASTASIGGASLLDGTSNISVQGGPDSREEFEIDDVDLSSSTLGVDSLNVTSPGNAQSSQETLDIAISTVLGVRAEISELLRLLDGKK